MYLNEFITKHKGNKVDFDGAYGGQCVDLYRAYVKEVLQLPQIGGIKGASQIWDNSDKKYFESIKNTLSGVPKRGDIVIWNTSAGGGYGHVAIFLSGNVHSFESLDQNWPTLSKVTETEHTYKHVIGWLRPKLLSITLSHIMSIYSTNTKKQ